MIHTTPYVAPSKNLLTDFKRLSDRREVVVSVIKRGEYWMVKHCWANPQFKGQSDYHLLGLTDTSFTHPGQFVISLADWMALQKRSLNQTNMEAKEDIHEWKYDHESGPLRYRTLPKAKIGDPLRIIRPHIDVLGAVKVRTKQNDEFVVYLSQLQCPSDASSTTRSGASSAT